MTCFFSICSGTVITAIGLIIVKLITVFTGLIMFAKYHDCDPLLTKVTINDIVLNWKESNRYRKYIFFITL